VHGASFQTDGETDKKYDTKILLGSSSKQLLIDDFGTAFLLTRI
jgi:hypothetical protein